MIPTLSTCVVYVPFLPPSSVNFLAFIDEEISARLLLFSFFAALVDFVYWIIVTSTNFHFRAIFHRLFLSRSLTLIIHSSITNSGVSSDDGTPLRAAPLFCCLGPLITFLSPHVRFYVPRSPDGAEAKG